MRNIKSIAAVGLMALTLGVAFADSAEAQYRRHYKRSGGIGRGGAVAAGIIGGALLGAALAPRRTYAAPVYEAPAYGAPAYSYEAPPPAYYAPARPAAPVLIGVQQTRNCEIRTYQDAYGRQFSRKVCPQRYYY